MKKWWFLLFLVFPLLSIDYRPDNTAFVQNIINTGGTLPTGTYTCSSLTLPLSFNMHGSTIFLTNTTGAGMRVTANNVTLQNGTIIGLSDNVSSNQSAIQDNFANFSATGLVIKQFGQYAISAFSSSPNNINNLSITNDQISDIGYLGVSIITNFGTVTGITVSGNTIDRSMQPTSLPQPACILRNFAPGVMTGALFVSNTIKMPVNPISIAAEGIEVRGCIKTTVHDNNFIGGSIAVSAVGGSNNLNCYNNTCNNQNNEGIELGDIIGGNAHNNTISGGKIGVLVDGGSLCTLDTISNTSMTGLTSFPIQFYSQFVHGIVINSVIASTNTFAMYIQNGANQITVTNSTFNGNGTSYAIKFDNSPGGMTLNNDIFNNFQPKLIVATASIATVVNNIIGVNISPTSPSGFLGVTSGTNVTLGSNISFNAAPAPPVIAYHPNSYNFLINSPITPINISSTGGTVTGYSINTPQPSGLLWSTSTAQFSGTPLALSPLTSYVVTGVNGGGSDTAVIKIAVIDRAPVISYAPSSQVCTINVAMTPMTPNVSGGGEPTSFTVSPALPSNITLNPTTGQISGTGLSLLSPTVFTIFAFNSGGSTSFPVTLSIVNPAPVVPNISFSPNTYSLPINVVAPTIFPINIGGNADSWGVSPALPTGLTQSSVDGSISGTPTVLHTLSAFDISATNVSGTSHATLNLAVVATPPPAPNLFFTPNSVTLVQNQSSISIQPSNSGGAVTPPYSITPALSPGLVFNVTNATLSGTPSTTSPAVTYQVSGSNITGTSNAPITITIVPPNPAPTILVRGHTAILVF